MDRKKREEKQRLRRVGKIRLTGFYLRNLGANLVGVFTVALLNFFTPANILELHQNYILRGGGWWLLLILEGVICCVVLLFQYIIQRPIATIISDHKTGKEVSQSNRRKGERRVLNLPYIFWFFNLVLWILLSLAFITFLALLLDAPLKQTLLLMFRTMMIGLIAANLSFFLVEDHARELLIPHFFPQGKLKDVPGTLRISVKRRIRILYLAGTSVPMIILLGTLSFTLWGSGATMLDAGRLSREIFLFTLVLCILFVIIALRMNFLVGKSILDPIKEMLAVIEKVPHSGFGQKIRVTSNDELGVLGDTGNAMMAGLAERERIRETFGKYVTPEIRDRILEGRIPLDGEQVEATLLFSDLRGFTSYVERNAAEEAIRSMRAYFTAMEKAIRSQEGLVLQYVGDEIECVFGVPLRYEGHADKAVLAALEMRKRLNDLNTEREKEGKGPFRHGIGIHTGSVLAGNTGSEDRLSYSLIGDTVNLASRIQDLTKVFGCDILLSRETANRLQETFQMEELPPQMVKGYSRPIVVYRII